jgi:hypothetical protein
MKHIFLFLALSGLIGTANAAEKSKIEQIENKIKGHINKLEALRLEKETRTIKDNAQRHKCNKFRSEGAILIWQIGEELRKIRVLHGYLKDELKKEKTSKL